LPYRCDENEKVDPNNIDDLMPWSDKIPEDCKKRTAELNRFGGSIKMIAGGWFDAYDLGIIVFTFACRIRFYKLPS